MRLSIFIGAAIAAMFYIAATVTIQNVMYQVEEMRGM